MVPTTSQGDINTNIGGRRKSSTSGLQLSVEYGSGGIPPSTGVSGVSGVMHLL